MDEAKRAAGMADSVSVGAVNIPTELSWTGNMAENWRFFKQKFNIFLLASGNEGKESNIKTALLLSCIGDRALKLYNTFELEKTCKDDIAKVLKKFDEHFLPEKNITYERYKFFTRNQKPNETYEDYIVELRDLSATCEFGSLTESLIKDRLVYGIQDIAVKDRLLRTKNLKLSTAADICRTSQQTKQQIEEICSTSNSISSSSIELSEDSNVIDKINRKSSSWNQRQHHGNASTSSSRAVGTTSNEKRQTQNVKSNVNKTFSCRKCGYNHQINKCPAFNRQCLRCNKYNHYASQCKNTYIRELEEESGEEINSLFLGAVFVNSVNKTIKDWSITVGVDNIPVQLKVDTGAQANVLVSGQLSLLGLDKNNLLPSKTKLTTYTGEAIHCLGKCLLPCKYEGHIYDLEFYVVNSNSAVNIIGLQSAVQMQLINPLCKVDLCQEILEEYADLFQGLGCMKDEYDIKIKENASPVVHACRKVPLAIQPRLKAKLDELEKLGVVSKVTHPTDWVNSLVIVYKPDGQLRLCIDPQDLNQAIQRQHFELPTFDEITSKLTGANFFSTLDIKNGFWNLKLSESSSDLCCFNTPFGRFKFLRMPFGLCSASEIYQQKMRQILENMEGTEVYIDDILIYGKTQEEHDKRLRAVLDKIRQENIKLNKEKCKINVQKVKYLGHIISKEGLKLDDSRIESIMSMKSPTNKKELERFMGVINYVAKFIPNLAMINSPLRNLLKKDIEFHWLEEHEKVFQKLKQQLVSKPVLQFFNEKLPVVLSVDASKDGLGAVIFQNNLPVAYASKALNDCQKNYAQIEKELLAILFGCEKFNQYIYGRKVTIETDHAPLVSIVKKALNSLTPRIQRMLLKLQKYQFDLVYKRGKELYVADTLSRSFNENDSVEIDLDSENIEAHINIVISNINATKQQIQNITKSTKEDEELQLVKKYITDGWPTHKKYIPEIVRKFWKIRNDLTFKDDIIFKNNCIVIPLKLRKEMLNRLHLPHLGITKTQLRAHDVLYWPGINNDIYNLVSSCQTCKLYSSNNKRETLIPHKIPELPWQKIAVDLFELNGRSYLLAVDYFTKFPELSLLNSTTSECIVNHLKSIFSRNGIPKIVMSDGGPQFSSEKFSNFSKEWDFEHKFSSPEYPQSNGMVERTIQTVKNILKKAIHDNKDPYLTMLEFRNTPISNEIPSPAEGLFNRKLKGILPMSNKIFKPKIYNQLKNSLKRKQEKSELYYNHNKKNLRSLVFGEKILFKIGKQWRKGEIKEKLNERSYMILSNNKTFIRNRLHIKPLSLIPFYISDEPLLSRNQNNQNVNVDKRANLQVNKEGLLVTSSGRVVHPPNYFHCS